MPSEPRIHEPAGGDALLFIVATAIITVVAAECAFIAYASWWLMFVVLFGAIVAAIGVVLSLVRLIDQDTPVARPKLRAAPAPAVRTAPVPSSRTAAAQ